MIISTHQMCQSDELQSVQFMTRQFFVTLSIEYTERQVLPKSVHLIKLCDSILSGNGTQAAIRGSLL